MRLRVIDLMFEVLRTSMQALLHSMRHNLRPGAISPTDKRLTIPLATVSVRI